MTAAPGMFGAGAWGFLPCGADGCVLVTTVEPAHPNALRIPVLQSEEVYLAAILEWAAIEAERRLDDTEQAPPVVVGACHVHPRRREEFGHHEPAHVEILALGESVRMQPGEARALVVLLRQKAQIAPHARPPAALRAFVNSIAKRGTAPGVDPTPTNAHRWTADEWSTWWTRITAFTQEQARRVLRDANEED